MRMSFKVSITAAAALSLFVVTMTVVQSQQTTTPAPAGFDDLSNGFLDFLEFNEDKDAFEEVEGIEDGLGPVYNSTACVACHQNPVTGGSSQVTELRAGRFDGAAFFDHPGGSLINDRAIDPAIQERVHAGDNVRAVRSSLNLLGDGFIEAIADSTFYAIRNSQDPGLRGQIILVPVLEATNGAKRVGRFGWKDQHASLESFAADAYVNEMGITSPLQLNENTSNGQSTADYDTVADPENLEDVHKFAQFMRSTKVPPRDTQLADTPDAIAGSQYFTNAGCAQCHVPTIVTAPVGARINGGTFVVPRALGSKVIHPFSDFLLHDVGTGDGIVQNGGPDTRNKMRTPPLWGLRTRNRLMHDLQSFTLKEAIRRHQGDAASVVDYFNSLSPVEQQQLFTFLNSL